MAQTRINKVLNFCYKEFGINTSVVLYRDSFSVYSGGDFIEQISYSEIGA